jgi:membrane associated rhomboid family serine protease
MRGRYPSGSGISYSFGPGPLTSAIKIIVIANVVAFVVDQIVLPDLLSLYFGLSPSSVFGRLQIWQPVTYMFLHGGIFHLLFNMLALWMFGVELERMWGTKYFTKYYFVCGVGAAVTTLVLSVVPGDPLSLRATLTIGASGAIYGILLAYALYYPNRPIYMYMVFPIPAKYFVMIMGGISLFSAMGTSGGGVAHITHLGGLIAGYLYLKGGRLHLISEIQYRYLKWKINRTRRKFDVYSGGRGSGSSANDVNRRVH